MAVPEAWRDFDKAVMRQAREYLQQARDEHGEVDPDTGWPKYVRKNPFQQDRRAQAHKLWCRIDDKFNKAASAEGPGAPAEAAVFSPEDMKRFLQEEMSY